jgi:serine/threonine protein kinase
VITYILLCGFCPFAGDDDFATLDAVTNSEVDFPSPEWDDISKEGIDFIKWLLQKDPERRPTAAEAMQHPWIISAVQMQEEEADANNQLPPPIPLRSSNTRNTSSMLRLDGEKRTAFQKFLRNLKIKKALGAVTAGLTPLETTGLGDIFRRVDKDKDGVIHLDDIEQAARNREFSRVCVCVPIERVDFVSSLQLRR